MKKTLKIKCPNCNNIMVIGKKSIGRASYTCCFCHQDYVFTPDKLNNPDELEKQIHVYFERPSYIVKFGTRKVPRKSQRSLEIQ